MLGFRGSLYAFFIVWTFFGVCSNGFAAPANKTKSILNCTQQLLAHAGSDAGAVSAKLIASAIQMEKIREHLQVLTGERAPFIKHTLEDRYFPGNKELAALYLFSQLNHLGLEVSPEPFTEGLNFYVEIPGTEHPEEVFELSAHYDTAGPDVGGADDNGSGLGVLLEAARIFSIHRPKKTLRIVFMDLEEVGFIGSAYHAKRVREEFYSKGATRRFMGALVVDMIGWSSQRKSLEPGLVLELGEQADFAAGPKKEAAAVAEAAFHLNSRCAHEVCFQFLRFANEQGKRPELNLRVDTVTAKPMTGDHGSYWQEGIPALFLAAPYEDGYVNPENHTRWDTISAMNWDYYTNAAKFALEAVATIVDSTPHFENSPQMRQKLSAHAESENPLYRREAADISVLFNKEVKSNAHDKWVTGQEDPLEMAAEMFKDFDKSDIVFVLESNSKMADLVAGDESLWLTDENDVKEVMKKVRRKKILILKRKNKGLNTAVDLERISDWLEAKQGNSKLALPKGYEQVDP